MSDASEESAAIELLKVELRYGKDRLKTAQADVERYTAQAAAARDAGPKIEAKIAELNAAIRLLRRNAKDEAQSP